MKSDPKAIWKQFRTALCDALKATSFAVLEEVWKSGPNKTAFYENALMPKVAKLMGGKLKKEKHRCDYALLNSDGVPIVFAEAENNHGTASHEIMSLCALTAPLKVLLISCDWKETEKMAYLPQWAKIIRTHHAEVTMDCLYAIIVGGWEGDGTPFEYISTLLDTSGKEIEELNLIEIPSNE